MYILVAADQLAANKKVIHTPFRNLKCFDTSQSNAGFSYRDRKMKQNLLEGDDTGEDSGKKSTETFPTALPDGEIMLSVQTEYKLYRIIR